MDSGKDTVVTAQVASVTSDTATVIEAPKPTQGLSEHMAQQMLQPSEGNEFAPSWGNRRRAVFLTLFFSAGLVSVIVASALLMGWAPLFGFTSAPVDYGPMVANILTTALYLAFFLGFSALGVYIPTASWDQSDFRSKAISLLAMTRNVVPPSGKD